MAIKFLDVVSGVGIGSGVSMLIITHYLRKWYHIYSPMSYVLGAISLVLGFTMLLFSVVYWWCDRSK